MTIAEGMFLPKLSCSIIHFSKAPSAAKSFYFILFFYIKIFIGNIWLQPQNFQSPALFLFGRRNIFLLPFLFLAIDLDCIFVPNFIIESHSILYILLQGRTIRISEVLDPTNFSLEIVLIIAMIFLDQSSTLDSLIAKITVHFVSLIYFWFFLVPCPSW